MTRPNTLGVVSFSFGPRKEKQTFLQFLSKQVIPIVFDKILVALILETLCFRPICDAAAWNLS